MRQTRDAGAGPLFSVITVCFNAATSIRSTADSLACQTFRDYEWLVVDGASTDGTLLQVERSGITQRRVHSEPDQGIYDAMNKAIGLARGQWLHFLNAGDAFADERVLFDVAASVTTESDLGLLFGDMIYFGNGGEQLMRYSHVGRRMLVFESLNHQAVFAHRSLFERFGRFDLAFRTSADYDWLLRVFRGGAATRYLARRIARFEIGGTHSRDPLALAEERRRLRLNYVSPSLLWCGTQLARVRGRWFAIRDGRL